MVATLLIPLGEMWLEEDWERLPKVLSALVVLPVFVMGMVEFAIRSRHKSKRVLELKDKKVVFGAKRFSVRWEQVRAFQFEPIAGEPDLRKLTLVWRPRKKNLRDGEWSLVLSTAQQFKDVISEMNSLRETGKADFGIEMLDSAKPPRALPKKPSTWLLGIGFTLLVIGMPLLGVGLTAREGNLEENRQEKRELSEKGKEKLQGILLNHFKSAEEFRMFLVWLGGGLTLTGAVLMVLQLNLPVRRGGEFLAKGERS